MNDTLSKTIIIAGGLFFVACSPVLGQAGGRFYIEINDNGVDHGCYHTYRYFADDSALTITYYSEHGDMNDENYRPEVLLEHILTPAERKRLRSLVEKYVSGGLVTARPPGLKERPCDEERQMSVEMACAKRSGKWQVNGYYDKKVARLLDAIDACIPPGEQDLRIIYKHGRF
ncbi:hypothetical protein [Nemorincola caseinilytica]|uniref:hypothetical protein n=1 Tax=Nemorincola caseinilytica TaxID=2054315 RepID=UPI0031EABF2D